MISNVEGWIRGISRSETWHKRILSEFQYSNITEKLGLKLGHYKSNIYIYI